MAGIKSLAVRGIRSFGPDECDEQRIAFEKPLTLILGQNGCGKTTIIECLRYAITGQMPPGSRNECFVHDAKVNRSTEVLGQVKVKIVNAKDKQLEVSRSMRVTAYQNKKPKFQTLDSFLSVVDEKGKTKDISSRCADLDFVMHEELGVSKAILNSVIFCHQEDSSWPLDEGKKVKDRFDEIFDADKYSDCFDRLRKIRKEYAVTIKLLEQEVSFLTEKKQDLDKKKLEMVNTESSISESEIKVAELAKELKPISEKLTAIETLQKNLVSIEFKKEKIKTRLEHNETQKQELEKAIQTLFEGTIPELQEQIKNYGATGKNKQEEINDSYKKIFNFNSEEEKIANEKTANEVKYDRYVTLESQNQDKMDKRNQMIVNVAKLAEIELDKVETDEDAMKGMMVIANKLKDLHTQLKEQKAAADEEEKKLQKIIDESRDALSRHKQKISNKESEIQTVKKDITKIEKQVNDANKSKDKLEVWEQKLKTAEDEYEQLQKEVNVEECQNEMNSDEKTMEAHEQELELLNDKITNLQKQSAKLKEKDMVEESLKQKEKQLMVLTNKHKSDLTKLLGNMPEKDFALAVSKVECEVRTEVESLNKKITENQNKMTRLEAERTHTRTQLCERRAELTAAEEKMYRACGTLPYDDALAKLTTSVEKLQDEQNILQSSMFIIAKYKGQLKDNNCCPLCNRGFDSETEVTELISQLTTQVMNVPSKLEKVTEELQRASAKKDDLLGLRAVSDQVARLKDKDIPVLETRLAEVEKEIAALTESSEELSMLVAEPEGRLGTARALRVDMPLLDRCSAEVKTALRDLEVIKEQCAGFVSDMSLDDATAKQTELRQKVSALRAQIKSTQAKINQHNKKLQKSGEKKNKFKEELLNIQKKVQELCNLQETQKQLESNREKFLIELNELKEAITPLEQVLKEKDNDKNEAVKKLRGEIEIRNSYISKVASAFEKVKSIETEIKQHKERNVQKEMDKIKEANEKLMEKHKQIVVDRNSLTKRLDTLKDELAKQEIYKRNLEDNLKLRNAVNEIETCQKELAAINEKLSGMNVDSIKEKPALISRETELLREKANTEGQLTLMHKSLAQTRLELKKTQNKDIEHQYREKYYELHVLRAVDRDVRDYSAALERCLMEYHRGKMENINLIIREMWRKIYRGNDIDYIEIKTEGSMTESDRRKYDYRVIQCKNGVEIDMRGRCSAGQKVLACLIIRLALAETFSSRFGILALDEPTTNLDQENVRSLCSALGEIVQERMTQKNFMFVIITHDKEFIDSLGNIDKVTHYYEVSRNEEGKSRVKKIRFT